jgi:hypothetical protein
MPSGVPPRRLFLFDGDATTLLNSVNGERRSKTIWETATIDFFGLNQGISMNQLFVRAVVAVMLCVMVPLAHAAQRGKSGAKQGGGRSNEGQAGREREGQEGNKESERNSQGASGNKAPGGEWSQRSHSGKSTQATGAQGAAAGAAASNRKSPQATGAQGAAAGAAAANRNSPTATGAQGAAAGAAAANRKAPAATGAQGAAAGAAAANQNSPTATGAQGAVAGAAVANRNSPQFSGAEGAAAGAALANSNGGYAGVRNGFNSGGMYGAGWYGNNPGAWAAAGWGVGAAWMPTSWNTFAGMYGYGNNAPVDYDYGGSVNYQNGNVIVNGQNVGTAEEFSQQAYDLADAGTQTDASDTEKWMPLGVFAMVRDEKQPPKLITQLAINEQGI